jgi:hypothetical protein
MVSLLDASDINQLATQAFDRKIEPELTIPKKQRRSVYEWYVAPFKSPD